MPVTIGDVVVMVVWSTVEFSSRLTTDAYAESAAVDEKIKMVKKVSFPRTEIILCFWRFKNGQAEQQKLFCQNTQHSLTGDVYYTTILTRSSSTAYSH